MDALVPETRHFVRLTEGARPLESKRDQRSWSSGETVNQYYDIRGMLSILNEFASANGGTLSNRKCDSDNNIPQQLEVNTYVCIGFAITVSIIAVIEFTLTNFARAYQPVLVSIGFCSLLAAYVLTNQNRSAPSWVDQGIGLLGVLVLCYLSFAGFYFGTVCVFVVAPSFAFLCYTPKQASWWSIVVLSLLMYGLYGSNLVPYEVVSEGIRRGLVAAVVIQTVLSGVASFVVARYKSRLVLAEDRARQLEQVLPLCMDCKSINTGIGWKSLEEYLTHREGIPISHGLCAKCYEARVVELKEL